MSEVQAMAVAKLSSNVEPDQQLSLSPIEVLMCTVRRLVTYFNFCSFIKYQVIIQSHLLLSDR